MGFSTTHLIIFLVIIIVIFGTKKLRNIGSDLGADKAADAATTTPAQQVESTSAIAKETIDVEAKTKV
jgi:sec-independent protein translocase protein TatA